MAIHFTVTKGEYLTIVNLISSLRLNEYTTRFVIVVVRSSFKPHDIPKRMVLITELVPVPGNLGFLGYQCLRSKQIDIPNLKPTTRAEFLD